jgi:hypothetical protein
VGQLHQEPNTTVLGVATSGEVPTLLGEALKALKSTLYRPRLLALMLVKLAAEGGTL